MKYIVEIEIKNDRGTCHNCPLLTTMTHSAHNDRWLGTYCNGARKDIDVNGNNLPIQRPVFCPLKEVSE